MQTPGSEEAIAEIDVRAIRSMLRLTRAEFALRYGFDSGEVVAWESGKKKPAGASRVLLILLDRIPDEIQFALRVN